MGTSPDWIKKEMGNGKDGLLFLGKHFPRVKSIFFLSGFHDISFSTTQRRNLVVFTHSPTAHRTPLYGATPK